MKLLAAFGVGLALCLLSPAPASACLWDYDTLKEESLRQPEVAATVMGDLGKHSEAFYQAKLSYTQKIIDAGGKAATADRYDDLAVAYARLGKLDQALTVLDQKDAKFPGLYTTLANRGTFLVHKGDLPTGLDWLKKAVALNPNAHFGREKYQLAFIDYMQRVGKDPTLASSATFFDVNVGGAQGFENATEHFRAIGKRKKTAKQVQPTEAVIAIVGIMRFGEGQANPHLWWGLAWGLVQQGEMQLAARAFRRAELLGHPRARMDGMNAVSTLAGAKHGCCMSEGRDLAAFAKQWDAFAAKADAEFAKGDAKMLARQKQEDKSLTKQPKKAFGY